MSQFFKLNNQDFIKGAVVFVLAAVFASLAQMVDAPGFAFASFNWAELGRVAFGAMAAYLSKNLLTTADGKVGGVL